MTTVETRYEHIVLDDQQVAYIAGTTMKLVELVTSHKAYGWSPEELVFQYPHLSLGQVYSALAFYWDHKDDLERDMERRLQLVDELRRTTPVAPIVARLREQRRG